MFILDLYPDMKKLLVLFFLYISVVVFASEELNSYFTDYRSAIRANDTALIIKATKKIGNFYSEEGKRELSNRYLAQALDLSKKKQQFLDVGKILNLLGNNESEVGNRTQALNYYTQAIRAFAKINDASRVAMVQMNIGTEYAGMGNYSKAIAYELKALKNKEASGDLANLAYYYQKVGELFKNTDIKKWKEYIQKAYHTALNDSNSSVVTRAGIFNDLAGIAHKEKDYKQAYAWYDSMYVVSRDAEYSNGVRTSQSNRCIVLQDEKRFDEALQNILPALINSKQNGATYHIITNSIHAGSILLDLNRPVEARKYVNDALKLAQKENAYPEELADSHRLLAKINELIGDYPTAYVHYKIYRETLDSTRKVEAQNHVQELETKYKTATQEKQIAQLDNENQLKNWQLNKRNQIIILLIIIILLSVTVFALFYIRKQLTTQKKESELNQKLLRSQMNPHFLFNTLNAINQFIQNNQGRKASDYLANYAKLTRQILENSDCEYILLEEEIDFLKNYLYLQQLRFSNTFVYEILIADNVDIGNIEIPPMLAQPIIENAIEHGIRGMEQAKITISFGFQDKDLLLVVTDNGKGFSTDKAVKAEHKSFGVEITRERLGILGRKSDALLIESPDKATGVGAKISIKIPFKLLA